MCNIFRRICELLVSLSLLLNQNLGQQCLLKKRVYEKEISLNPNSISSAFNDKQVEENYYLPQTVCDYSHFVGKSINPYKNKIIRLTPSKKFRSICLRCATCLAIAQQINEAMQSIKIGSLDPTEEIKKVENNLKRLCNNGFRQFDLRNYKGYTVVMKASHATSHVCSDMDGRWPSKLREVCSIYLEHINFHTFYNILLKKAHSIPNYLCRSDGVFRDCSNIDFKTVSVTTENYETAILFKIECIAAFNN